MTLALSIRANSTPTTFEDFKTVLIKSTNFFKSKQQLENEVYNVKQSRLETALEFVCFLQNLLKEYGYVVESSFPKLHAQKYKKVFEAQLIANFYGVNERVRSENNLRSLKEIRSFLERPQESTRCSKPIEDRSMINIVYSCT
jgi:galactokinase